METNIYFAKHPTDQGKFIGINHGETGYHETTVYTQDHADELNRRQDITPSMVLAAVTCSMFNNWDKFDEIAADEVEPPSHPHAELFETVNALLADHDSHVVAMAIRDCHNGKLDGRMITQDNLHLFRRFRNDVELGSANPIEMIDKARAWATSES